VTCAAAFGVARSAVTLDRVVNQRRYRGNSLINSQTSVTDHADGAGLDADDEG
jgi:hypothetical protein